MTLCFSKSRIKKAIQECLKQVEKAPKDKRLWLKLGDLYLKNGEKEKAVNEYLKAGDLNAKEELNFRAIAIYKKVVSIDPKHIEAFHKIAKLYLEEDLLGDAGAFYERILKIRPKDKEAIKALSAIEHSKQLKRKQLRRVQAKRQGEVLKGEQIDSLISEFPVLFKTLEEDFPLYLCECPHCRAPFWVMPTPDYFFTCSCGGISVYEDLVLKTPSPEEHEMIKTMMRMKTVGSA
jgi:tetratricopeptide (TPR) repeat protein